MNNVQRPFFNLVAHVPDKEYLASRNKAIKEFCLVEDSPEALQSLITAVEAGALPLIKQETSLVACKDIKFNEKEQVAILENQYGEETQKWFRLNDIDDIWFYTKSNLPSEICVLIADYQRELYARPSPYPLISNLFYTKANLPKPACELIADYWCELFAYSSPRPLVSNLYEWFFQMEVRGCFHFPKADDRIPWSKYIVEVPENQEFSLTLIFPSGRPIVLEAMWGEERATFMPWLDRGVNDKKVVPLKFITPCRPNPENYFENLRCSTFTVKEGSPISFLIAPHQSAKRTRGVGFGPETPVILRSSRPLTRTEKWKDLNNWQVFSIDAVRAKSSEPTPPTPK